MSNRKVQIIDHYIICDTHSVIPAKAGKRVAFGEFRGTAIQQDKNAFCLNPLDSRFRGNDVANFSFSQFHSE
jgi:hypothetical protein